MPDDKRPSLFPSPRMLFAAAVAGLIAGAAAVYVTGGWQRNTPLEIAAAASSTDASPENKRCEAKAERAKATAAAATGQVAGIVPAEPPVSLNKLAFNSPAGKPMAVADLSGKTLLLNLWATWCAPCRAEMPSLDALQKERGSATFEVVAVNVDTGDDSKPQAFLADTGAKALAYYRDNTLDLFKTLQADGLAVGLPVTLLIDPEGCLLARINGPAEWSGPDALKFIDTALAG